jgi:transcriptional regulator with XRE-family HTH domain
MAQDTTGILAGLRTARERAGVSQLDLAQDAGVGYRTVQNAEAGRVVSSRTLVKIADALDVPAAVLLEGER